MPGVWRLRLPLPWPGVPHCNAWAVAAGDGVVLFDCGLHEPHSNSLAGLERALEMCGLRLSDVRLLVCTHAHADHYGQAGPVARAAGCELWMHPHHDHVTAPARDPGAGLARRIEIARQSGVPVQTLRAYALDHDDAGEPDTGIAEILLPARELRDDVIVETDLGPWIVHETPGHAPSHVCLLQPDHRLLISGDHLLGRVSLYFDFGWSPDPVGDFLASLQRTAQLDARLCLAGHGRPFADVQAHIVANERLVATRLQRVRQAIASEPLTAFEAIAHVHEQAVDDDNAAWWLAETNAYLAHLQATGAADVVTHAPERWLATDARP